MRDLGNLAHIFWTSPPPQPASPPNSAKPNKPLHTRDPYKNNRSTFFYQYCYHIHPPQVSDSDSIDGRTVFKIDCLKCFIVLWITDSCMYTTGAWGHFGNDWRRFPNVPLLNWVGPNVLGNVWPSVRKTFWKGKVWITKRYPDGHSVASLTGYQRGEAKGNRTLPA